LNNQEQKGKKEKKKKRNTRRNGKIFGTVVLIGFITMAMLACMAAMYIKTVILPNVALSLDSFPLNLSTSVYYEDDAGQPALLQRLHGRPSPAVHG